MMKTWWLKLYSFPDIKDQVFLGTVCCLIHIGLYLYFPDYIFLSVLAFAGFLILPSMPRKSGFGNHLAFHEMSISRTKLRNAFFADFLIHAFVKACMTAMCVWVFIAFDTKESVHNAEDTGRILLSSFVYHFPMIVSMLFAFRYFRMDSNIKMNRSEQRWAMFQLALSLLFIALIFNLFITWTDSRLLGLVLLVLSMAIGFSTLMYRDMFHEIVYKNDYPTSFKYLGFGALVGGLLLMISNFLFFNLEFRNKNVSMNDRADEFVFWGRFSPQLTTEDFILVAGQKPFSEIIYKKAPKGYENILISDIFPDRNLYRISGYLRNVKPSNQNLLWLAEVLEHNRYMDDAVLMSIQSKVLKNWPVDLDKPKYIAELFNQVEKQSRSIASERRLRKKAQILDRY